MADEPPVKKSKLKILNVNPRTSPTANSSRQPISPSRARTGPNVLDEDQSENPDHDEQVVLCAFSSLRNYRLDSESIRNNNRDMSLDKAGSNVGPENDRLEYKSLQIRNKDMSVEQVLGMFRIRNEDKQKKVRKEFNAMLNYGGGKVRFGIAETEEPNGTKLYVVESGIKLTDDEKEKINDAIHRTFNQFYPSCSLDRGDYEVEWETISDKDGDERYRFAVIINRCSAYKRGRIVCMNNVPRIEAYTRSGSASVPMSAEEIQEKLRRTALTAEAGGDYARWTQASIDARLIQRLRDALDKYENKEIEANDIIRILQQYAKEIDRQRYISYFLVQEVLNVMQTLAYMLQSEQTKIKIAAKKIAPEKNAAENIGAEIVNLGNSIYYVYVLMEHWYKSSDGELCVEANFKILAQNMVVQLFEVCFRVAHEGVKYCREANVFAKATAVLAKILSTLHSAPESEIDDKFGQRIKDLDERYKRLEGSIQDSGLDKSVQDRLLELHRLLLQRYIETKGSEQSKIEKRINELGYVWY